jgi:hypothetical protein
MSRQIVVEVLIATPPTSKCEATLGILEELVRRHPDEIRLVVFRRGVDFLPPELQLKTPGGEADLIPKPASGQMRIICQKGSNVPYVVVDGENYSSLVVPDPQELEEKIQQILQSSAA